jgi:XapX domain-containing protein
MVILKKPGKESRKTNMIVMLSALLVGIFIGAVFKLLKLPVPVPHDFAGIVGLIGMFAGSALVDVISKLLQK